MQTAELGHLGCQDVDRHHGLRLDAQQAGHLLGVLAHRGLGLFDVAQDQAQTRQVGLAGLGECVLAGGALQQPCAQVLLQIVDQAGHHGGREVHAAGGGGKAAFVHDGLKNLH